MGMYLNPGNILYEQTKNDQLFVDKTGLITLVLKYLNTRNKYLCVSRPRRFGKSTDADMLTAYFSKGCDSLELFHDLKISNDPNFKKYINAYQVIHINMQNFISETHCVNELISALNEEIGRELVDEIKLFQSDYTLRKYSLLRHALSEIVKYTQTRFVFVIDEWDCLFRDDKYNKEAQEVYLDYLRSLLKDNPYIDLVYMTGILPIKKYGTHSALNMFMEISMINASPFESYMGFTDEEVRLLCKSYQIHYDDVRCRYNGYHLGNVSVYCPKSIHECMTRHNFANYWSETETYEALKVYIDMNFDGLKDAVIELLAGKEIEIDTTSFQNDMTTFSNRDDVLTLFVHLGYLGFRFDRKTVYIPNREVYDSFVTSVKNADWHETSRALINSTKLLEATWNKDAKAVSHYIEEAHLHTSILQYNDENALSYTIMLAYYRARDYYTLVREMPTGKDFCDIAFLPKDHDHPAMLIELKWDHDAETAIRQIKEKKYDFGLRTYRDRLLLVTISYDRKTKKHQCIIENFH